MKITKVAVIGAGNMGSGIAQKIATEGVPVLLVDASLERAKAGKERIALLLAEGIERRIFTPEQVNAILERIAPVGSVQEAAEADLVIEAVFEDLQVKRALFKELAEVCRPEAILATNTSSFLVGEIAVDIPNPERVIGLHYFYHPAKNRLVEVIGHKKSSQTALKAAWSFQERIGKTPIASLDAPGFVVNRFFVPWLNEAVRLHEEGIAISTIEAASKASFGIGMGPFELMNVTGVPITLHATESLGKSLGAFYDSAKSLKPQVDAKTNWELKGDVDPEVLEYVSDRLWGVVFHVAAKLVDEGVGSVEDTDIGAKVGLRWPVGPFEKLNSLSVEKGLALATQVEERYSLGAVPLLLNQAKSGSAFELKRVVLNVREGVATITINRPDQLNAIDPITIEQLEACFLDATNDESVRAIVIAGAGKAFVAGADVKFFVDKIKADSVADVVAFAANGQRVYRQIELSEKPVICKLDGLSLGGGSELALACHIIVATKKASMGFPETGIGIYPGLGGTQRLTRRLGKGLARYFLYSGAVIGPGQLEAWNLAWKVVSAEELDQAIEEAIDNAPRQEPAASAEIGEKWTEIADFLASASLDELVQGELSGLEALKESKFQKKVGFKAPRTLQAIEKLTSIAAQGDHLAGLEAETAGLNDIFSSADALEGLSSLLEGRRPTFLGR